jgi:hypothetical protein
VRARPAHRRRIAARRKTQRWTPGRCVALQVAFERRTLKPVFSLDRLQVIGLKGYRLWATGQLDSTCRAPPMTFFAAMYAKPYLSVIVRASAAIFAVAAL